jgi:hypothetical protein
MSAPQSAAPTALRSERRKALALRRAATVVTTRSHFRSRAVSIVDFLALPRDSPPGGCKSQVSMDLQSSRKQHSRIVLVRAGTSACTQKHLWVCLPGAPFETRRSDEYTMQSMLVTMVLYCFAGLASWVLRDGAAAG